MWSDEGITWFVSSQSLSRLVINSTYIDAMFLPYYLFMHFWLGVSHSLWWMRLPSLLAGAAAVQALVLLARRWLPLGWSVLAGFLLALNPLFTEYTRAARPYTALALLAVLSTAALVNAIDRGGRRRWALYGLASACMVFAHLLAAFVLAAHLAGVAIAGRRSALAGMAATLGWVTVAVSPLAVLILRETQEASWIGPSTLSTFHRALADVSGRSAVEEVALVICVLTVAASLARIPSGSDRALGLALCLAWGTVPILLVILAGFLQPLYTSRYSVMAIPGIALAEALAGWRISAFLAARLRTRQRRAYVGAALTCGAACLAGLALLHTTSKALQARFRDENYRAAAAELNSDVSERPASVAVISNMAGVGFSYYVAPPGLAHAIIRQEIQEYDRHLINFWGGVTFVSGVFEPLNLTRIIRWPIGVRPEVSPTRCAAGWAIGRGTGPSRTLVVDGSICRVLRVHQYGSAWVASLSR